MLAFDVDVGGPLETLWTFAWKEEMIGLHEGMAVGSLEPHTMPLPCRPPPGLNRHQTIHSPVALCTEVDSFRLSCLCCVPCQDVMEGFSCGLLGSMQRRLTQHSVMIDSHVHVATCPRHLYHWLHGACRSGMSCWLECATWLPSYPGHGFPTQILAGACSSIPWWFLVRLASRVQPTVRNARLTVRQHGQASMCTNLRLSLSLSTFLSTS